MPNRDITFPHQNFFDYQAYDPLTFSDIQRFSITAQAREKCRKGLGQSKECSPIVDSLSDGLQLRAKHLFTIA